MKVPCNALLHRCQCPLHLEHTRNGCRESRRNLVGQQHRRVGLPALDTHDGLSTHSRAQRQFLLRHILLKAQTADAIAEGDRSHE